MILARLGELRALEDAGVSAIDISMTTTDSDHWLHTRSLADIEYLQRFGCDPTAPNAAGEPPLHLALRNNQSMRIARLIQVCADASLNEQSRGIASQHTASLGQTSVAEILSKAGATFIGRISAVMSLIERVHLNLVPYSEEDYFGSRV